MKCRLLLASLAIALICPTAAHAASRGLPAPRAACVDGGGNTAVAVFDVAASRASHVPVGRRNRVSGGRVVGKQPSSFVRGSHSGVLRVRFTTAAVSWRLGTTTARLARSGRACASSAKAQSPVLAAAPVTRTERPSSAATPAPAKATTPAPSPATPSQPISPPATSLTAAAFGPASFWNASIPANVAFANTSVATGASVSKPVNPTVGQELATFAKRSDGSSNTWINYKDYTAPITVVPANAKLQPVRLCRSYPNDCIPSWAGALYVTLLGIGGDGTYLGGGVPVPAGFTPPTDNDAEAIFYQPDYIAPDGKRGRVWELWGMRRNPDFNS